jgi:PhnB protein
MSPWLISRDTAAEIAFLAAVFGAEEIPGSRVMDGDAVRHVEVSLVGSSLLMFDAAPSWPQTPSHLRLYVDDLDATLRAAVGAEAVVITEATTMPFGDIVARLRDPQGHRWWLHHHVEEVPPDEMFRRFADPETEAAMIYLADSLDADMTGGRRRGDDISSAVDSLGTAAWPG